MGNEDNIYFFILEKDRINFPLHVPGYSISGFSSVASAIIDYIEGFLFERCNFFKPLCIKSSLALQDVWFGTSIPYLFPFILQ